MTEEVERQLVTRASAGDRVAIESLLARELPALRTFVRLRAGARIRQRESCSDLVQSVCREVLEEMGELEYRGAAAFRHFLFTAALRKIFDRDRYWRQEKRDADRDAGAGRAPASDTTPDLLACYGHSLTPSREAIAHEQLEAIERAVDGLNDDQREVLTLVRIVGLSYPEVAAAMGRSEAWCRTAFSRALARISLSLDA